MAAMSGKTVLVTGGTNGIGEEAALALAKMGAHVVVHGRSAEKGEATLARIRGEAPDASLEFLQADLSSLEAIEAAATSFLDSGRPLDVLLNNAGAMHTSRKVTSDGFEMTFGVNHLAYFALTARLLPALKKAEGARIVNVASEAHRQARKGLSWDDMQSEQGYSSFVVYGQSKLANILFTRELARRLDGSGITTNCLHPGVVATGFAKNDVGWMATLWGALGMFLRTPAKGAATSIYLASSPAVAGVTGEYFSNCKPKRANAFGTNDEDAARLWTLSEQLTGLSLEA